MKDLAKLRKYMLVGVVFVIVFGTLLHFAYELLGRNVLVSFFAPINESVWEHFKLGFYSFLVFALFIHGKLKTEVNNYWFGVGLATLILNSIIFVFYYIYTKFTGQSILYVDIGLYILATLIAFNIFYRLLIIDQLPKDFEYLGLAFILLTIIIFAAFTTNPPDISLFKDAAPTGLLTYKLGR